MTVARFWREQKNRYNLLGTKCANCGRTFFPPKEVCMDCHRKSLGKMESVKLNGNGKILSYTIIHDGAKAFYSQIPYVLAIIELDEGPKITAQIVDYARTELSEADKEKSQKDQGLVIGSQVTCVFRKICEDGKSGTIHYGYKFKLRLASLK